MPDREKVIRIIDELIFEARKAPTWKAENALRCLKKELLKEQETPRLRLFNEHEYVVRYTGDALQLTPDTMQELVRCKDCRYWKHKYMDYPMHDELPCMHYHTDGDWFCGSGQPIPQEETYVYFNDGSVGKITYLGTLNPEREGDNDVE